MEKWEKDWKECKQRFGLPMEWGDHEHRFDSFLSLPLQLFCCSVARCSAQERRGWRQIRLLPRWLQWRWALLYSSYQRRRRTNKNKILSWVSWRRVVGVEGEENSCRQIHLLFFSFDALHTAHIGTHMQIDLHFSSSLFSHFTYIRWKSIFCWSCFATLALSACSFATILQRNSIFSLLVGAHITTQQRLAAQRRIESKWSFPSHLCASLGAVMQHTL